MTNQPILKIEKINKVFETKSGDVWVLKNVDLEVNKNDFVILFGPSGCGKSTLLHMCIGLETITSGSVRLLGEDIGSMSDDQLAEFRKNNIGIVYQQSNWIVAANVLMNVAFPLLLKGYKKEDAYVKAKQALDLVGMSEWINYYPSDLSSGQQQKVGLARCLVSEPKIIIADEPTGNLDYKSSLDLITLFKSLSEKGVTILMVTHNMDNLDHSNKIFKMFDGQIVQSIETKNHTDAQIKKILQEKSPDAPLQSKSPRFVKKVSSETKQSRFKLFGAFSFLRSVLKTLVLILLYCIDALLFRIFRTKLIPRFFLNLYSHLGSRIHSLIDFIDKKEKNTIRFIDLASISVTNLLSKKSRSFITVGGIAIGIAFTVLLISIGYGVENLVVSRAASLDELQRIEVSPAVSSNIFLTDRSVEIIGGFEGVEDVFPIVSVAGIVSTDSSQTESVLFAVTTDYLSGISTPLTSGTYHTQNSEQVLFGDNVLSEENLTVPEEEATYKLVDMTGQAQSEVIVNNTLLQLFGISSSDAVGEVITIETIVTSNLTDLDTQIRSTGREYKIVGVLDEGTSPVAYIPIYDLEIFGVNKFSQAKVILDNQDSSHKVRTEIETLGFKTTSISDTIVQIEEFFRNLRVLFAAISAIALIIASLGMFNTLTVSLLERTREVGLMKAVGMKSNEVKELFMSESILMGVAGGVIGIFVGVILGYVISLLISMVSLARGGDFIAVTYLPLSTCIYILILSCIIGAVTGMYPARRATRISALNALRYE